MKVSYELTRHDLAALMEFHHRSSTSVRRQVGCVTVGILAMLILPLGILLTSDKPKLATAWNIWPLLLSPLLFAILAGPYIRWRTRQLTNRMLSEGQNNGFYGPCELELGADSLTETRPSGTTIRNWTAVERIVVTSTYLFIYTSGIEAYVLPRRAFSSESKFTAFVGAVAESSGIDPEN